MVGGRVAVEVGVRVEDVPDSSEEARELIVEVARVVESEEVASVGASAVVVCAEADGSEMIANEAMRRTSDRGSDLHRFISRLRSSIVLVCRVESSGARS